MKSKTVTPTGQARQGDVLLVPATLPPGAQALNNDGRTVLAHGELTGHAHAVGPGEVVEFRKTDSDGAVTRFLKRIADKFTVRHEEHAPIQRAGDVDQIIQQREYDEEISRNVAD